MLLKSPRHCFINRQSPGPWIELQGSGVVVVEPNFKHHPMFFPLGVGRKAPEFRNDTKSSTEKGAKHGKRLFQCQILRREAGPFGQFSLFTA